MKKIYILIIFTIFVCFSACNESKKDYYNDGSIKSEFFIVNDKIEGAYKEYYESTGELKFIAYYKSGLLHGEKKSFYRDGKTKSIENYIENQLNGDCIYYNSIGRIDTIKNYILINPKFYKGVDLDNYNKMILEVFSNNVLGKKSQLNSLLIMNKKGNVDLQKSHYFEIALKKDTISNNDTLYAGLFFRYRRNGERTKYIVYQFVNEKMDLYNVFETNHDVLYMHDKPHKKGVNYLCGYIEEYTPYGFDTLKNVLFFKKKYFVK